MARSDWIAVAPQEVLGTANTDFTNMGFFPQVKTCDLDATPTLMETEETTGDYGPEDFDPGTLDVSGGIEFNARWDSLGAFLSMMFGEPSTAINVAGQVFTHTFQMDGDPIPWTVFKANVDPSTDIARYFEDVVGDNFGYTLAVDDYMVCNLGCVGTSVTDDQAALMVDASGNSIVTVDSSPKLRFTQFDIQIGTYGGEYADAVTGSLTASHSNSTETDEYEIGSRVRYAVDPGNRNADITTFIRGGEKTYYESFRDDTAAFYKIKLTATGAAFYLANTYQLVIEYPRVQITSAPADINASERMKGIEIGWRAAKDGLGTITLRNANAGTWYKNDSVS